MRLSEPRVKPVEETGPTDEQTELLSQISAGQKTPGATAANIFRTVVQNPKFAKRWLVFANHVLFKSSISARERELLILRIGWLCQAEYEWAQHKVIGRDSGLQDHEIERVKQGPDADGWNERDALLLRATDELHGDAFISDSTWQALRRYYSEAQMIDLIGTVGNYNLVSMLLNSLGVQLDKGLTGF